MTSRSMHTDRPELRLSATRPFNDQWPRLGALRCIQLVQSLNDEAVGPEDAYPVGVRGMELDASFRGRGGALDVRITAAGVAPGAEVHIDGLALARA